MAGMVGVLHDSGGLMDAAKNVNVLQVSGELPMIRSAVYTILLRHLA